MQNARRPAIMHSDVIILYYTKNRTKNGVSRIRKTIRISVAADVPEQLSRNNNIPKNKKKKIKIFDVYP